MGTILTATLALQVLLLSAESTAACSASSRWCKYPTIQCLNASLALIKWHSMTSLQSCLFKASRQPDSTEDPLVQWNGQTGVCSIFQYQQICRAASSAVVSDCSTYRLQALATCETSVTIGSPLIGVWLAGRRHRLSNLVCQPEPSNYQFESTNLLWTDEGASFDGSTSYGLLRNEHFVSNNSLSNFTWLIRLKRVPKIQPFIEFVACSDGSQGPQLWEFDEANMLFFNKAGPSSEGTDFSIHSDSSVMPGDQNTWIDVGIAAGPSDTTSSLFAGQQMLATVRTSRNHITRPYNCFFMGLGRRFSGSSSRYLEGVVSAVAIANVKMSELQMRQVFEAFPPR